MEVMGCHVPKISSDTVKAECSDIYQKNIGKIKREILKSIGEINKSKSVNVDNLQSFSNTFYSKDVILSFLNSNPNSDKNKIINGLRTLLRDTESRCLVNFNTIEKLITFYKRDKPYKDIYNIFELDGLTRIDLVDVEIILDAHHIGLQVGELFFITGDYLHIIPRRDIIKKNTSLKDVIGLGEFQAESS
ncbi:MAG: hypothetical protein WCE94_14545 [Candidatus Methanoperedens sp.]